MENKKMIPIVLIWTAVALLAGLALGFMIARSMFMVKPSDLQAQIAFAAGQTCEAKCGTALLKSPLDTPSPTLSPTATEMMTVVPTTLEYYYCEDEPFLFEGSWIKSGKEHYHDELGECVRSDHYKHSKEKGASVKFAFEGEMVRIGYTVGPMHGIADVLIDGEVIGKIDAYAAEYGCREWTSGRLAGGTHQLEMIHTGESNPAANVQAHITLDYIAVGK